MTYFVTGATGFIGRHLVERLLERDGEIHVLVRPASIGRLDALIHRWGGAGRIHRCSATSRKPLLGLDAEQIAELRGTVDHFFHLAAIYDMTADEERDRIANVEGTRHAVELANALEAGCFHHVSSIAVAGAYRGPLPRGHVRRGPAARAPLPPHEVRVRADRARARRRCRGASTARPIVVGHSQTGEMDKIDGPYYFFKLIQRLAARCRRGSRSSAPSSATRTSCRSTTSPPRWTTSPTQPGPRRPRVPPRRTRVRSARSTSSTRSRAPPARRGSRCRSTTS